MRKRCFTIVAILVIGLTGISQGQDIQSSPTASQTITQPNGTSLNIQGNVGIGTTNATVPLQISIPFVSGSTTPLQMWAPANLDPTQYGLTLSQSNTDAGIDFRFSQLNAAAYPVLTFSAGLVGVNVDLGSYPQDTFSVKGGITLDQGDANDGTNTFTSPSWPYHSNGLRFGDSTGEGIASARVEGSVNYNGLDFYTAFAKRLSITQNGNVGIGTVTPGQSLQFLNASKTLQPYVASGPITEIAGTLALSTGQGGSILFQDGTIQSTAYLGNSCPAGGDYAESVDVIGDRAQYEPGDVMVIDPSNPGHVIKSFEPYSTLVAGIYSTKPGFVGRRQTTDPKNATSEIPMAMVGVVPTKVTAENGPIKTGDLLVTSSTLGYVMKGTDRNLMTGAVVGKAFGKLDSGTGVIEVLVSLQ